MNDLDEEQQPDVEETFAGFISDKTAADASDSGTASDPADSGEPTAEQKREIARWINEGVGLSDVQKRLADEFGHTLTYMEVRFLVDDLDLDLLDEEEEEAEDAEEEGAEENSPADREEVLVAEDAPTGGVSVSVDKITRPGVMASGVATFSDGVSCPWYLDQFGRLGLSPADEGYKPPESDLQDFQQKLDSELRRSGI